VWCRLALAAGTVALLATGCPDVEISTADAGGDARVDASPTADANIDASATADATATPDTGTDVDAGHAARDAYLGLDLAIEKALVLAFRGFNSASSADIDPQMDTGATAGTMTVTGQVDQGASDNKQMRLYLALEGYGDTAGTVYATYPEMLPYLELNLMGIPSGTLAGTLTGRIGMAGGGLSGDVSLDLTITATLEPDPAALVRRVAGTTHVTGSATSIYGTYPVDMTF